MKPACALLLVFAVGCSGAGGHARATQSGPRTETHVSPLASTYKGKRLDQGETKGNVPKSVLEILGDARLHFVADDGTFVLTQEGHVLTGTFKFDNGKSALSLDVRKVDGFPRTDLDTVDLAQDKAADVFPRDKDELDLARELMENTDWSFHLKAGVLTSASPEGAKYRYEFTPDG